MTKVCIALFTAALALSACAASGPAREPGKDMALNAVIVASREGDSRAPGGLLGGARVLLKDNIDTVELPTTAGSLALAADRPARDAFLVGKLREAGGVIAGKTNLSEWANFRSTRSSSGWSAVGGQTRNPYALDRNTCGSSSGSAAAVAAGLAELAVATETDGSIVCPSSVNGVVGIKPTVGLVSRAGIVPISATQDTAGPMATTVTGAALLLQAMAGVDPADPATQRIPGGKVPDYREALKPDGLQGARIGVARNLAGFHEKVDAVFEASLAALRKAGATIVDPVELKLPPDANDVEMTVLLYEFKDGINRYLKTRPGAPQSLQELIRFNEQHAPEEMRYFGQEIFLDAQAKGPLTEPAYLRAVKRSRAIAGPKGIDAVLKKHRLDAIVAPTMGPAWTTDLVNGDHYLGGGISQAPAMAGYPHVTVPAGFVEGLPVGLSFVGTAWSESKLIGYAYAFEQASLARRPPEFKASIP